MFPAEAVPQYLCGGCEDMRLGTQADNRGWVSADYESPGQQPWPVSLLGSPASHVVVTLVRFKRHPLRDAFPQSSLSPSYVFLT